MVIKDAFSVAVEEGRTEDARRELSAWGASDLSTQQILLGWLISANARRALGMTQCVPDGECFRPMSILLDNMTDKSRLVFRATELDLINQEIESRHRG